MAAVIAAVVAAFLAGAIALYRKRRLEIRRLRVAARVLQAEGVLAMVATELAQRSDSWKVFDETSRIGAFENAWEEHRDILAGHLPETAWSTVLSGVRSYLLYFHVERGRPPNTSPAKKNLEEIETSLQEAVTALVPFGR